MIEIEDDSDMPTVFLCGVEREQIKSALRWLIEHDITVFVAWDDEHEMDKERLYELACREAEYYRLYPFLIIKMSRCDAYKMKMAL